MNTIYTNGSSVFSIDDNKNVKKVVKYNDHISGVIIVDEDSEFIYDNENGQTKLNVKAGQIVVLIWDNDSYGPNKCFVLDSPELKENILFEKKYREAERARLKQTNKILDDCCENCPCENRG